VTALQLQVGDGNGRRNLEVQARNLIIAGWTARDRGQLEQHIRELAGLGISPPPAMPVFYRLTCDLLVQEESIQVVGPDSSGEAEAVLMCFHGELWVGVGSDHTDRRLEAVSIAAAKQVCAKPLSTRVWPFGDVQDHWDELVMRSYVCNGSGRELYQSGVLGCNLAVSELLERLDSADRLAEGTVLFCGTLPVIGKLRGANRFEVELEDMRLARTLKLAYGIRVLATDEERAKLTSP
jgi:hypothetical protein